MKCLKSVFGLMKNNHVVLENLRLETNAERYTINDWLYNIFIYNIILKYEEM